MPDICLHGWGLFQGNTPVDPSKRYWGLVTEADTYLRKLLIHGARAVLFRYKKASEWMKAIVMRRGFNKACVALANKTARIVWALLSTGERYQKVSIRSALS